MNARTSTPPRPAAPVGDGKALADLVAAGNRLIQAIEEENALLRAHRTAGLADVGEAKRSAGRAYEEAFAAVLAQGAGPIATRTAERDAIRRLADRLRQVAEENEQRLRVAITASRRVLDAVADAVRDVSAGPATYYRIGTYGGNHKYRPATVAVSVNRTL